MSALRAANDSPSPILTHARAELAHAGLSTSDDPADRAVAEGLLVSVETILRVLGDKMPLSYAIAFLPTLLSSRPINLLTGADDEWVDMTEHNEGVPLFQNKRCSSVFKNGTGVAFDVDGLVYRYPDGIVTHRSGKVRMVQFPYDASTDPVIVDVDSEGNPYFDFDFQAMPTHETVSFCGADAMKWAHFFCQTVPGADVDVMFGWFANAIEAASDSRHWARLRADDALSTAELKALQNAYSLQRSRDMERHPATAEDQVRDARIMEWLDERHRERKLSEFADPKTTN